MPAIRIELDTGEFVGALDELARALDVRLEAALRLLADQVAVNAKTSTLFVGSTNSLLRNSIEASEVEGRFSDGQTSVDVAAGAPYALFVELGTRAHVVEPRFRRALRWAGGNGFVFAKRARIPAQPPRPFMQRALEEVEPRIDAEISTAVELAALDAGLE